MLRPIIMRRRTNVVITVIINLFQIIRSSLADECGSNVIVVSDETIKTVLINKLKADEDDEIKCFDTSTVTNMNGLFENTSEEGLEYIHFDEFNEDISSWDTSSVTNMDVSALFPDGAIAYIIYIFQIFSLFINTHA